MDPFAPTILRPWVRFPFTLFSISIWIVIEKRTKISQKEALIDPYFIKNNHYSTSRSSSSDSWTTSRASSSRSFWPNISAAANCSNTFRRPITSWPNRSAATLRDKFSGQSTSSTPSGSSTSIWSLKISSSRRPTPVATARTETGIRQGQFCCKNIFYRKCHRDRRESMIIRCW